jgi:hypothetical protein
MNLEKLILKVLEEQPVETPTKPETKPTTKPSTKPKGPTPRRPLPGRSPNPDAKKSRIQKEREAFAKRHGIKL